MLPKIGDSESTELHPGLRSQTTILLPYRNYGYSQTSNMYEIVCQNAYRMQNSSTGV